MLSYTSFTEDQLLKRLRSGDEVSFTEIYNRYWEKLLAIGYFHLQNKQSAEDIVHEVFMSLWIRKNDLEISSLSAYLATSVKFTVFKTIMREKRRMEILNEGPSQSGTTNTEDQLDAKFLAEYIQGIVEQLPEKAKLVFELSRDHELSVKEIARKMDLSPKAVEYHMTKALRALRNTISKIKSYFL